jgi:SNF2 family DNA or RNA helicase
MCWYITINELQIILVDVDWNPHVEFQAENRIWRIGQTKEVITILQINHNNTKVEIIRLITDAPVDKFKNEIKEVQLI